MNTAQIQALIFHCCVGILISLMIFLWIGSQQKTQDQTLNDSLIRIQQFYQKRHHYPKNLQEAGIPTQTIVDLKKSGIHYTTHQNGQPFLFRTHNFIPFISSTYDFKKQQWGDYQD